MNPREVCRHQRYPVTLLTTYSFDPLFFERIVLPDLWAGGSSSVVVFVDRGELHRSLDQTVGGLRHLGRRYLLQPVDVAGAFHPKIMLRLGPDEGLAWLGSCNLTRGGWGANSELATAWRLDESDSDRSWVLPLLEQLRGWADSDLVRGLLDRCVSYAWIATPPDGSDTSVLIAGTEPLARQLERRWEGRTFTSLRVLTGSTDREGSMLQWAVEQFGIESLDLCVTPERAMLRPDALDDLPVPARLLLPEGDKPLHAKFYWFDGPDGAAVVWGSANCSQAAWLVPGHNVEAVVVGEAPDRAAFEEVLGVFASDAVQPTSVLRPPQEGPDETARPSTEPFRVRRASVTASGSIRVGLEPPLPVESQVTLDVHGVRVDLTVDNGLWSGISEQVGSGRYADVGRLYIRREEESTSVILSCWLDREHELREVLAGRDFRASMGRLRAFESKAADRRLADEIGKIGYELLHDTAAYPDARVSQRNRERTGKESAPLDPQALLVSLGDGPSGSEAVRTWRTAAGGLAGVFRALFAYHEDDELEAAVDDDGNVAGELVPAPRSTTVEAPEVEVDQKASRILHRHVDRFFDEFEKDEFPARCTATQLTQAAAYPIAVAVMGERRRWCTPEEVGAWAARALRCLLRDDRFHRRNSLFTRVQRRYEREGQADQFLAGVGDGKLWLALLVACDRLPSEEHRAVLKKISMFREFRRREELLAYADQRAIVELFRSYYDAEAIEAARAHVLELGDTLMRLEERLTDNYEDLKSGQAEEGLAFRTGDFVWSLKGGWGIAEADQKGHRVDAYVVQADELKTFRTEGWLVNISQLEENPSAPEALREAGRSFIRLVRREVD